jgi:hypothetical protein
VESGTDRCGEGLDRRSTSKRLLSPLLVEGGLHRAYIIAEPCLGTKVPPVDACPVDCIHRKDTQYEDGAGVQQVVRSSLTCRVHRLRRRVPVCPVSASSRWMTFLRSGTPTLRRTQLRRGGKFSWTNTGQRRLTGAVPLHPWCHELTFSFADGELAGRRSCFGVINPSSARRYRTISQLNKPLSVQ